jgi:hypothetical protein
LGAANERAPIGQSVTSQAQRDRAPGGAGAVGVMGSAATTSLPSGAIGFNASKFGLSAAGDVDGSAPAFDLSKFLSGIPVPQMAAPDPMMQALMDPNAAALQATLQRQARMEYHVDPRALRLTARRGQ